MQFSVRNQRLRRRALPYICLFNFERVRSDCVVRCSWSELRGDNPPLAGLFRQFEPDRPPDLFARCFGHDDAELRRGVPQRRAGQSVLCYVLSSPSSNALADDDQSGSY